MDCNFSHFSAHYSNFKKKIVERSELWFMCFDALSCGAHVRDEGLRSHSLFSCSSHLPSLYINSGKMPHNHKSKILKYIFVLGEKTEAVWKLHGHIMSKSTFNEGSLVWLMKRKEEVKYLCKNPNILTATNSSFYTSTCRNTAHTVRIGAFSSFPCHSPSFQDYIHTVSRSFHGLHPFI